MFIPVTYLHSPQLCLQSGDFVHGGGLNDRSGGAAFRLHASLPVDYIHRGCGLEKDIEWCSGPSCSRYTSLLKLFDVSQLYLSSNRSLDTDFTKIHQNTSFEQCFSVITEERANRDNGLDAMLNEPETDVRAGDIVAPVITDNVRRTYGPLAYIVSCISEDDEVHTVMLYSLDNMHCNNLLFI